jgi:hypothetical protein
MRFLRYEIKGPYTRTDVSIESYYCRSRFSRRLHRLADVLWTLLHPLGETWKALNEHLNSKSLCSSSPVRLDTSGSNLG